MAPANTFVACLIFSPPSQVPGQWQLRRNLHPESPGMVNSCEQARSTTALPVVVLCNATPIIGSFRRTRWIGRATAPLPSLQIDMPVPSIDRSPLFAHSRPARADRGAEGRNGGHRFRVCTRQVTAHFHGAGMIRGQGPWTRTGCLQWRTLPATPGQSGTEYAARCSHSCAFAICG